MSHVTEVDVEITDLDCLEQACAKLGLELVRGKTEYKWYGRHVGDYPLPAGFSKEDMGKCEHVIRIVDNDTAYEIGVVKRRDGKPGYTFHYDFWSGGYGLMEVISKDGSKGHDCERLINRYSAEITKKAAYNCGYSLLTENVDASGKVELLFATQ